LEQRVRDSASKPNNREYELEKKKEILMFYLLLWLGYEKNQK
jgi:hypothetical protein